MRSSTLLTLMGAALAVASPVHQHLHKKAIVWDIVTDIVYVTVTEGNGLKTSEADATTVTIKHTKWVNPIPATTSKKVIPTTSSTPPPPPPPSTSSTPPPAPPPPTTSAAPAPAPTTVQAAVFVATSAAPVPVVVQPVASVAAPAAPASNAAPSDYASTALYHHNLHRANHSAPALSWSSKLAASAQTVANKCVFAHDMSEDGGNYGQNIAAAGWSDPTNDWDPKAVIADAVSNGWYNSEYENYAGFYGQANPPPEQQNGPQWLHFTQIVWKDTTTVGCASVNCPKYSMFQDPSPYGWFTVCNYGPSGNFAGEYGTNVNRPTEGASSGVSPKAPWAA